MHAEHTLPMENTFKIEGSTKKLEEIVSSNEDKDEGRRSSQHAESESDAVDHLQQQLGGYGRYQCLIYILIGLVYMRGGWHVWVLTPQSYEPGHHCKAAPGMTLNQSVPGSQNDNGIWVWNECQQYVNSTADNVTEACNRGFDYDWGDSGGSSPVSKYDLVCDDYYLSTITSTMYMVGTTCGVVFLTPLSDRFGSKKVMLICLWVQAVFGTCIIWAPNVIWFCVMKFFIGMCNMTIALCAYILMSETFDAAHRVLPIIFLQFFWATSIMSLALFDYLLPQWEAVELLIALLINILSISYVWLVPESLPWLLSKGKTTEAEKVINRFIKINRLVPIENLKKKLAVFEHTHKQAVTNLGFTDISVENTQTGESQNEVQEKQVEPIRSGEHVKENYSVLDLLKYPRLRLYSLLMSYLFLANALAYLGIMYTSPSLNGNRHINMFLLGVVELPAYLLCYLGNRWIGRRRSISIFLFVCASANIGVLFVPDDMEWLVITLVMIGKFGITGSYSSIYLYAAEVFPTVIRNQAVGACSFFENIGSIASPSMDLLKVEMNELPLGIFGGMSLLGAGLVLLLPETHNRTLPQTIEEAEKRTR